MNEYSHNFSEKLSLAQRSMEFAGAIVLASVGIMSIKYTQDTQPLTNSSELLSTVAAFSLAGSLALFSHALKGKHIEDYGQNDDDDDGYGGGWQDDEPEPDDPTSPKGGIERPPSDLTVQDILDAKPEEAVLLNA